MEPGEALGIAAQVAVALAGFAGVVVVFRREAVHEWSGIDKLRLRLLLANSIVPLGLSMLGLLLLTIKPMPPEIWRWCSVILLVATVSFVTATTKAFRRLNLPYAQRDRVTRFVFSCSEFSAWQRCSCNYTTSRCSARSGHFSRESYTNSSPLWPNLRG
jgi:hypothetical protein